MLRGLVLLLLAFSIVLSTQAQSLEFETVRSQNAPGFFALRIFPGSDLTPIPVENVYVKNFKNEREAARYEPLLNSLTSMSVQILTAEDAKPLLLSQSHRLVWLGGQAPLGQLHFVTQEADIMTAFTDFSQEKLGPVYLTNLDFNFGGNVSEVYPERVRFLGMQATIYGKFERPIKTRFELTANAARGEISAVTPLYLDEYVPLSESYTLAEDWEAAYQAATNAQTRPFHSPFWLSAFPWLMFLGGLVLIALASIQFWRREDYWKAAPLPKEPIDKPKVNQLTKEWWEQPIEETPMYQDWEKNLPFEVVKKNSKSK